MNHSPEPWNCDHGFIQDAAGLDVFHNGNTMVNRERIVACVNACRAFSTAELDGEEFTRRAFDDMTPSKRAESA
jgi:hypothetical protein